MAEFLQNNVVLRLTYGAWGINGLVSKCPYYGHLCGYVLLPPGYPWYGAKEFVDPDYPAEALQVYGGITYAQEEEFQGTTMWALGFDTGHTADTYPPKDMKFVVGELVSLMEQVSRWLPRDPLRIYRPVPRLKGGHRGS